VTTVDVLLPHFGRLDVVQETISSVLAQEDSSWRLTVVDDGADDALASWCASLCESRLRYLRNPRRLGINRNFQKCVSLVRHDLAVIIGSDDVMLPSYVETVRRVHAAHPTAAVIQPGVEVIDENGRSAGGLVDWSKRWIYSPRVRTTTELRGEALAASLLRGNWLYFPSLCWRAEPLRRIGFREGLHVVQDLALVLDLVLAGESLVVEPRVCFQYRRHRASVSSALAADGRRFVEEQAFFLESAERMERNHWHRAARVARRHVSSRLNALSLLPAAVRRRRADAVRALGRHILGRPGGPRAV
jgi:glycosyltransferase involved in cell wall biosynthesis